MKSIFLVCGFCVLLLSLSCGGRSIFASPFLQATAPVPTTSVVADKQEVLEGQALAASFFAGGTRLMLSYGGQVIDIWNMQTGTRLQRFDGEERESVGGCVAITLDGKRVFMEGQHALFVAWDREHNRRIPDWGGAISSDAGDGNYAKMLVVSPDSKLLVVGGAERVELRRVDTGLVLHVLYRASKHNGISGIAFSPDGKYSLIVAGNQIMLYDVATGHNLNRLTIISRAAHTYPSFAAFSPDSTHIVTVSDYDLRPISTTKIRLWNWRTGKMLREFAPVIDYDANLSGAFTPDGKQFITGGDYLHVWSVDTGKELRHFPADKVRFGYSIVLVSPDGKYVLSSGANTELWRLATGERVPFWTLPPLPTPKPYDPNRDDF